jgi:hypothetical protein
MTEKVIVKFKPPMGKGKTLPSESLNEALHSLAGADEMQSLLGEATDEGMTLAIEVFRNRKGRPVLLHITKEAL